MQEDKYRGGLKDRLEGFGAAPSADLWGKIDSALNEDTKRRGGIIWWWIGGAIAAVLTVGVIFNYETTADASSSNLKVKEKDSHPSTLPEKVNFEDQILLSDIDGNLVTNESVDLNAQTTTYFSTTKNNTMADQTSKNEIRDNDIIADLTTNNQESINPNNEKTLNGDQGNIHSNNRHEAAITLDRLALTEVNKINQFYEIGKPEGLEKSSTTIDTPSPSFEPSWEIGLATTYVRPFRNKAVGDGTNTLQEDGAVDFDQFVEEQLSNTNNAFGSVNRFPSLDFSIGYRFAPSFVVGSGLQFVMTNHINKVFYNAGNYYYDEKSNDYALSIPITLQYDFKTINKWTFNTQLGYINEIPLFSRKNQSISSFQSGALAIEKATIGKFGKQYLGAINWSAGVSYGLSDKVSLGFSSTLRWYGVRKYAGTYYKQSTNLWWGANLGLVWELGGKQ